MEEKYYTIKENEEVCDAELTFLEKRIEQLKTLLIKAEYDFNTTQIEEYKKQIYDLLIPCEYIKAFKLKRSRNI